MDLKNPSTANDIAAQAENLADRIEATKPGEPDRAAEYEIAALLLGAARVHTVAAKDGTVTARMLLDPRGDPMRIPLPWTGVARGLLSRNFGTDIDMAIALAERTFDGWGWDIIKWPRGAGGELPSDGEDGSRAHDVFVYDAEVVPTEELVSAAAGRSLIGQHTTGGGALLAAILRGYAFKVKLEAGTLGPVEIGGTIGEVNLDITDEERGLINDIVDRAEELEISPPKARIDRMMDIAAAHKNGCPLQLERFLHEATDFAFVHDFRGIVENIDRNTGKLMNEFQPRYAEPEAPTLLEPDGAAAGVVGADYAAIEARILARMIEPDGNAAGVSGEDDGA